MIQIPIHRATRRLYASAGEFDHEWATEVSAVRWFVRLQFRNRTTGDYDHRNAILDTGAPYSVVPNAIAGTMRWQSLGRVLTSADADDGDIATSSDWGSVPCDMGKLKVFVVDPKDGTTSSKLCEFVAKFALTPHPANESHRDARILLGAHFLIHNRIQLVLNEAGTGDFLLLPD